MTTVLYIVHHVGFCGRIADCGGAQALIGLRSPIVTVGCPNQDNSINVLSGEQHLVMNQLEVVRCGFVSLS